MKTTIVSSIILIASEYILESRFSEMKDISAQFIIIVALALAAVGIALFQYQRAETLERELLRVKAGLIEAQLSKPLQGKTSSQDIIVTSEANNFVDKKGTIHPLHATEPRKKRLNAQARWAIMEQPTYRNANQIRQRAWVEEKYGKLFAQLQLKPAELEKLKQLLLDRRLASRDVHAAAQELGLDFENMEEIRLLDEQNKLAIEGEIREALGEDNYARLDQYEHTGAQREVITQLESRLSYSGTPLSRVQSKALYNLFSRGVVSAQDRAVQSQIWTLDESSLTQAQSVLSAEQLNMLRRLMEEQAAEQALSQAAHTIRNKEHTSPEIPVGREGE